MLTSGIVIISDYEPQAKLLKKTAVPSFTKTKPENQAKKWRIRIYISECIRGWTLVYDVVLDAAIDTKVLVSIIRFQSTNENKIISYRTQKRT